MLFPVETSDELPLTVEDLRAQIGYNGNALNDLVEDKIKAAVKTIQDETSIRINVETWDEYFPRFPCVYSPITLSLSPVRSIVSVSYYNGVDHTTLDASRYTLFTPKGQNAFLWSALWPILNFSYSYQRPDAVKVRYMVGYDGTGSSSSESSLPLDPRLSQAIKALVSNWFAYRESDSEKNLKEQTYGLERIMAQVRNIDA